MRDAVDTKHRKNIETLRKIREKQNISDRYFGASFIQRYCRVGYNQAINTIEFGIRDGLLERNEEFEFSCKLVTKEEI